MGNNHCRWLLISWVVIIGLAWIAQTGVAGGEQREQISAGAGVLTGKVTLGPLAPAQKIGEPAARAAAPGVRIIIRDPAGWEVASTVSDAEGGYRISLPAGEYRVETGPLPPGQFTKALPAQVAITPGQATHLDIHVDTGIR